MRRVTLQDALSSTAIDSRLWLEGVWAALRFHRCVVFFVYDPRILVKTLNCFLLNGVIFLGSVLFLDYGLLPLLRLLLTPLLGPPAVETLSAAFAGAYHLLWLLPAHAISFLINCIWYNEIAELVVAAAQRQLVRQRAEREGVVLPASAEVVKVQRPDSLTFLSQEAYRLLLTTALFLQVMVAGLVPGVGRLLGFVGLSWLYALYCFDYKWSLHSVPLEARLRFFETHWAFFTGFGTVAALPVMVGSFYTGAAVVGVLFPLFIMLAADCSPKQHYDAVVAAMPGAHHAIRMPIFWAATRMVNWAISRLGQVPRLAALLGRRGGPPVASTAPAVPRQGNGRRQRQGAAGGSGSGRQAPAGAAASSCTDGLM